MKRLANSQTIIANNHRDSHQDTVTLIYMNIRGLNQKIEYVQPICRDLKPDILTLTETKLTKNLNLAGLRAHQIYKKRNGGCAIISNHGKAKLIKALGTYMCWSSIPYQQIPLHVFTCYLEPK